MRQISPDFFDLRQKDRDNPHYERKRKNVQKSIRQAVWYNIHMAIKKIPKIFRPLLWSLKWDEIDIDEDKEDIIVNAINRGTLIHWRWIKKIYGQKIIQKVLRRRLASEFFPESLNLAKILFSAQFRNAR